MSQLVTIFGGSGFVGRYIVQRLVEQGWRVRVAVRDVDKAGFLVSNAAENQVETCKCDILNAPDVDSALAGTDAAVNCVGVLDEVGSNTFSAVQAEAPGRIAKAAAAQGVFRMVHISSIGADAGSASEYSRTKAGGEAAVLAEMPDTVILRPSIIFGPEDQFFNRFAGMSKFGPTVPVVGADTKFQPVYVEDVAAAAVKGVVGEAAPGIYELGGPDVESFRQLMERMLRVLGRRRLVLGIPFGVGRLMALGFAAGNALTLGLLPRAITMDQIKNLAVDNVVSDGTKGFSDLGMTPSSMDDILPGYLLGDRDA